MHRLRSASIVRRLRFAAFFLSLKVLLALSSFLVLVVGSFQIDRELTGVGLGLGMLAALSGGLRFCASSHTCCPLCMTPVLSNRSCSKHRRARKVFGSYRLLVALSILFRNSFRCPYCNEQTAMKVRER
jgi:hypothetical protein